MLSTRYNYGTKQPDGDCVIRNSVALSVDSTSSRRGKGLLAKGHTLNTSEVLQAPIVPFALRQLAGNNLPRSARVDGVARSESGHSAAVRLFAASCLSRPALQLR